MTDESADGGEHVITVKSIQRYQGSFTYDHLGKQTQNDLTFMEEMTLTLECDCGERFRKYETAEDHLREVEG